MSTAGAEIGFCVSFFLSLTHSIASSTGHCIFHGTAAITGEKLRGECKDDEKGHHFLFHLLRLVRHSFNWPALDIASSLLTLSLSPSFSTSLSLLSLTLSTHSPHLPPSSSFNVLFDSLSPFRASNFYVFLLSSSSPRPLSAIALAIILCHSLTLGQMEKNKLSTGKDAKKDTHREREGEKLWGTTTKRQAWCKSLEWESKEW